MAFTVLENVSQDELNWYHETRYWMHVSDELTMKNAARREGRAEGLKEGIAEGKELGIAEGKHDKAVEAARNLIKMSLGTLEQIAQAQGLPIEEVQKLADEIATEKV